MPLPGGGAAFDDQRFALDLLEHKHVLVAPGSSFNVPYRNHFRITNLPEPQVMVATLGLVALVGLVVVRLVFGLSRFVTK